MAPHIVVCGAIRWIPKLVVIRIGPWPLALGCLGAWVFSVPAAPERPVVAMRGASPRESVPLVIVLSLQFTSNRLGRRLSTRKKLGDAAKRLHVIYITVGGGPGTTSPHDGIPWCHQTMTFRLFKLSFPRFTPHRPWHAPGFLLVNVGLRVE